MQSRIVIEIGKVCAHSLDIGAKLQDLGQNSWSRSEDDVARTRKSGDQMEKGFLL